MQCVQNAQSRKAASRTVNGDCPIVPGRPGPAAVSHRTWCHELPSLHPSASLAGHARGKLSQQHGAGISGLASGRLAGHPPLQYTKRLACPSFQPQPLSQVQHCVQPSPLHASGVPTGTSKSAGPKRPCPCFLSESPRLLPSKCAEAPGVPPPPTVRHAHFMDFSVPIHNISEMEKQNKTRSPREANTTHSACLLIACINLQEFRVLTSNLSHVGYSGREWVLWPRSPTSAREGGLTSGGGWPASLPL